jgi:hypothetical protein
MYCISEAQIEYILNDIRRNGVEMEDLQLNLLDHICCIVEQGLKEDDDFERFYQQTIRQFYKKELREIEVETINLLTYKNYYGMKKSMIVSGAISAVAFIVGSFFKVMHWPGAAVLLTLAMVTIGLVFLPLLALLKTREGGTTRDKIVLVIGALIGMLFFMSSLFKVMHWPGANVMLIATMSLSMFVLIPVYFFTGIRKPETKVNTIVTTVLLIAITGLTFLMFNLRKTKLQLMDSYVKSEQLLKDMQSHTPTAGSSLASEINSACAQVKAVVLQGDIGIPALQGGEESIYVEEHNLSNPQLETIYPLLSKIKSDMVQYNNSHKGKTIALPADHVMLNMSGNELRGYSNFYILNNVTQLQMFLANAENSMLAAN